MKIYRAIKTNRQTQGFGENKVDYYKDMGMKGHNGIDYACDMGEKMYWDVSIKGTVLSISLDPMAGFGIVVLTQTPEEDFKHIFWHLQAITVKAGQVIETGDLIGTGDSTGKSTGPHLHRGVKRAYLNNLGWRTKDYGNGYKGAIDHSVYFENIFVVDKVNNLKAQIRELQKKKISLLKRLIDAILKRLKGRKTI